VGYETINLADNLEGIKFLPPNLSRPMKWVADFRTRQSLMFARGKQTIVAAIGVTFSINHVFISSWDS